MSRIPELRPDLDLGEGYHSPRLDVDVRLNVNEAPVEPPADWRRAYEAALRRIEFHRYPDRTATELRAALGQLHQVSPDEIFCANGSNEVLLCLDLAFGGPGRCAALFEPTYALHGHIARLTGTAVVAGARGPDFAVEAGEAERVLGAAAPALTFLCSPNNPTGTVERPELVAKVVDLAPGLVVVDEAYGQFAPWSALALRHGAAAGSEGLAVVRTFSKTWALAAARLGYLVADARVVAACERVALPYHLSAPTQAAGLTALAFAEETAARVAAIAEERGRLAAALAELDVDTWPSGANFILMRPRRRAAEQVWSDLVADSVLVRDCSSWPGLEGCLRVTVGTPSEDDRFLAALRRSLGA